MKTIQIQLPADVEQLLNKVEGNQVDFIIEAIREKMNKKEKINILLKEGYQATIEEDLSITKDFEVVDLENWE